ncbi:MAG: hypothetical protein IIX62_05910 [Peptococcaceae bacterium]|jgi:hypothetical protein|nr:hypothetical protein [Peptococcaceae bacterium]MBQ2036097.1 hypothetical protein [Peptococcaceae bacterium]MBQ2448706.1 hypothetical protein [Peptococcaceae bacterium]MBQ5615040.1 hypothetical protein [Peptococcaceae bacterium]MBQ5703220.1 hypothetical protein [Peptococcaceae bacterium]
MTTSLRDVSSAQMVNKLAEMNCFEQECSVYGYAWKRENGKRMYSMSDDELLIQRTYEEHVLEGCSLTPVQQWSTRAIIKEETQEDLFFYFKLQLAEQLRDQFPDVYFDTLYQLQNIPADNQAEELLLEWQEELDGYFDEEELYLFAGAVDYAYVTKHLLDWRYDQLCKWIKLTKKQMMRKMQVHDNFERTFYGVAYQSKTTGTYAFVCNANEKSLYNKVKEMDEQGILHTPVYQKTYWYNRSNDLPKVRKQFEADLKELMDDTYMHRIVKLQSLPSAIPEEVWADALKQMEYHNSVSAVEGLRYWARRWNIISE